MANRHTLRLFRGIREEDFLVAAARSARDLSASFMPRVTPSDPKHCLLSVSSVCGVCTYYDELEERAFHLFRGVAEQLDCVWLELRVQEGELWDYTLFHSAGIKDDFSTYPEYWMDEIEPEMLRRKAGNAQEFSRFWGYDSERVEQYIRQWGLQQHDDGTFGFRLRGKAYMDDEHGYGECDQMFDFLRAIGGRDPCSAPDGDRSVSTLKFPKR